MNLWAAAFCSGCLSISEDDAIMAPFQSARSGGIPLMTVDDEWHKRLVDRFRELEAELGNKDAVSTVLARCLLMLLLGEASRATRLEARHDTLVGGALAFIGGRFADRISLKDVAEAVGRSPGHLATRVKVETGYTVGEWISSSRLAASATRLAHSNDGIDVIAESVGWQDRTHFTRQFKKRYGVTPAAWRRTQRGGGEVETKSKDGH